MSEPEERPLIALCPECKRLIFPRLRSDVTVGRYGDDQDVDTIACPECSRMDVLYSSREWQLEESYCSMEERDEW